MVRKKLTKQDTLLVELVLNGEKARKDLPQVLDCSERNVSLIIKKLKRLHMIEVAREEDTSARGEKMDYLGITLEGLVHFFNIVPALWDSFEEITAAPQNRRLLPLVFGKLVLFKGIQVQHGSGDLYQILIERLKQIFLIIEGRLFFSGGSSYFESHQDELGASIREMAYNQARAKRTGKTLSSRLELPQGRISGKLNIFGIENTLNCEIYLNLYLRYYSESDPFMLACVSTIDQAEAAWSKPSGWWGEILNQIMRVAFEDPELKHFFKSTIKTRKLFAESIEIASNELANAWNEAEKNAII